MSLSVLFPSHEPLVKEEEYDDYEYTEEPALDSGIVSTEMSEALFVDYPTEDVKREPEEPMDDEHELSAVLPLMARTASVIRPVPLFASVVKEEVDEAPIKEEPLDFWSDGSQQSIDALGVTNQPDFDITALLSLAAAHLNSHGVQQSALDVFNKVLKKEELEQDKKHVPLLAQASSNRRKAQNPRSSCTDDDDDEKIYISYEDILLPRQPKRGRPMGKRYSAEEEATDPKKRRQANNRDAALRYREKKKMETWELKNKEKDMEDKNAAIREKMEDLSREVRTWKGLFINAFHFLPNFDFDDHSPLSIPSASRRSVSATPSTDSTSSLPSSFPSCLPDEAALYLTAYAKAQAKRKQEAEALKQVEADLLTRNDSLRAEALQIYIEIVNMRKKMGFIRARTSADIELPLLLSSTSYSPTQISNFLAFSQS